MTTQGSESAKGVYGLRFCSCRRGKATGLAAHDLSQIDHASADAFGNAVLWLKCGAAVGVSVK